MIRPNKLIKVQNYFVLSKNTGFIESNNIEKLRSYVQHKGGASVYRQNVKIERYVVGIAGFKVSYNESMKIRFKAFIDVIHKLSGLLNTDGYGVWIDNNNDVYFDAIKTFESRKQALKVARENSELAIYDTKEGKAINV